MKTIKKKPTRKSGYEKLVEHVETFPSRRKDFLTFQQSVTDDVAELRGIIKEGLSHPKASPQTIALIGDVKDEMGKHVATHLVNDEEMKNFIQMQTAMNVRIEPYILKSEEEKRFRESLDNRGKILVKVSMVWTAVTAIIGSIYYMTKHIK